MHRLMIMLHLHSKIKEEKNSTVEPNELYHPFLPITPRPSFD